MTIGYSDSISKVLIWLHEYGRFSLENFFSHIDFYIFSAEEFGVETCCVPIDFSSGRDTYHKIWQSIRDKEIGVLGGYI